MQQPITDSHIHLLPGRLAEKVRAFFVERIADELAYGLDHTHILDELHAAGIGQAWSLPYAHKEGVAAGLNRANAQTVARYAEHPVKIIGGATVHPVDPDALEILREAFDDLGLRVVKLHCSVGNYRPDDPAFAPIWRLLAERKIPTVIHLGQAVTGHTYAADIAHIEPVAQEYSDAPIIVAHCGYPAGVETLALVERYPNLYADLTCVVRENLELPAERVRELAPKLLFGSDAPNVVLTAEQSIAHVRRFGLNEAQEAAIFGGTARSLLRVGG
jgi:uncharacterized protein